MTNEADSVNFEAAPSPERRYHHGDLRFALIEAGLSALESEPLEKMSLRALTRSLGVSVTAAYRHFPHKDALLDAIAKVATDQLGEHQRAASAEALAREGTLRAAFVASGVAYVRYARAHPVLFRLIWDRLRPGDMLADPVDTLHPAMRGLRLAIAHLLPSGASEAERRDSALHCWSLVHGLAMLAIDRQIVLDDAETERVVELAAVAAVDQRRG